MDLWIYLSLSDVITLKIILELKRFVWKMWTVTHVWEEVMKSIIFRLIKILVVFKCYVDCYNSNHDWRYRAVCWYYLHVTHTLLLSDENEIHTLENVPHTIAVNEFALGIRFLVSNGCLYKKGRKVFVLCQ